MRWLYHLQGGPKNDAFVHCSFQPDLAETIKLHFAHIPSRDLRVIRVDPRRLDAEVRIEGPRNMPHVYGEIPSDAITEGSLDGPDVITDVKIAVVGFARMTLLDLVGTLDPLMRSGATIEVVSATGEPWSAAGARFEMARVRPPLDEFDVVFVAGGPETRKLERDPAIAAWLGAFPRNRLMASVCTGALLLGAAGRLRGKRATSHHASMDRLADYGATAVRERVVRDGQVMTAGGVTSGIDLGLALVDWLYGRETRERIAARMEYPRAP